ncbi:hypothetical protein AVEN_99830-1 [Araneus ventricosus]|uniref:Uncharacterized protein n=1 Tax=Araneus ventricosus TaxID=182803 RepID=A0A4Y2JPZ5_ARAVE|nr:hypothetical protein AVEN_99830-1 [Araneus ventricosus]
MFRRALYSSIKPLIPKTIGTERPQKTGTPEFFKSHNDSWNFPNSKKTLHFANISGRTTLTKKVCAAGGKSITVNERWWKLYRDTRMFRTSAVVCL